MARSSIRRQKTERLSRLCRVLILSSVLCPLSSALAASPSSVSATYDIYKSGLKIGQIVESYTRDKEKYSLSSTTHAVGLLAIFQPGKIIITSNGLINSRGLQPLHFRDRRESDASRERRADFDWDTRRLTLNDYGQKRVLPLPDGTQDRLSAMYQFMFLSLAKADVLNFNMTNGSKLDIYNYRITPGQSVTVPLGTFKALYVASVPEAGSNRTEIWLAEDHANFPYKMVITDPDGGSLSQVLTRFDLVP
ncbi:MAG: DUF3108 domain-containing protein [Gallionella sp.]